MSAPGENADRLLFEAAPVMYLVAQYRGGRLIITDCNQVCREKLGYGRDELVGQPLSLIHPDLVRSEARETGAWIAKAYGKVQQLRTSSGALLDVLMRISVDREVLEDGDGVRLVYLESGASDWSDQLTIRENAERFRQMTENLHEVFFLRRGQDFIYVSPAFEKMFGHTLKGIFENSQQFLDAVHPDDLERVTQATWRERTEAPGTFNEEYRVVHPNGDIRWLRSRTFKVNDAADPELVVGVVEDITDWKTAEAALIEERERFQVLVDESPLGVSLIATDGRYMYLNRRFQEIFGYTLEDIPTGTEWWLKAFPDQEYRSRARKVWLDDLKAHPRGESRPRSFTVTCRNGEKREILFLPVTLTTGDQLVIYQDITESLRSETKLKLSEERYRTLFESSDQGLLVVRDEVFVDCNPKALEMFKGTREEILGVHPGALSPRFQADGLPSVEKANNVMGQALAGHPQHFQWRHLRRNGTTFEAEVSLNRFQIGDEIYLMSSVRDITERLEAEIRLKAMEQQLRQSQKMEAVGQLAGGVAHDFNNLLQAIFGYTQLLLLDKPEVDPDYSKIKAIQKAGDRASQLVKQLLLFSRRMASEYRPVQLNREVEQVKNMLERTIPKMVRIDLRLDPDLSVVLADPVQLEQTLLNLASNAADAMPDGGTLVFETRNVLLDDPFLLDTMATKPGRFVRLTVSDTGVGMDQETVEHIFEPFFTTKEIGKGTGLGLASVFGVVKGHQGHINCHSEVGRGTSFEIHLPAIAQVMDSMESNRRAEETPSVRGTETILIVDDEAPIRDFSTEVLESFGYRVLAASSGEAALQIHADHQEIKLVIMDLGMPGMGGKACLRRLLVRDPSTRVIIASGYSINDQVSEALNLGALGFVAKPFNISDLLKTIRRILDQTG